MVLVDVVGESGTIKGNLRVNNDSGNNYAGRFSTNGTNEGTITSEVWFDDNYGVAASSTERTFLIYDIANLSGNEKLAIKGNYYTGTAGAANAPQRQQFVYKWANTSNAINRLELINDLTGNFSVGSEVVVLGWDPADTHTTNFWQELASVELGADGDNLSSGTITAKKYLWVQAYIAGSGNARVHLTFNNDTTSYAVRDSSNGGTDATFTNQGEIRLHGSYNNGDPKFINLFIINNSANEKLVTSHTISGGTSGAANAPDRVQTVGKWDNTSAQITEIDLDNNDTGSFGTGSILKVWGAD